MFFLLFSVPKTEKRLIGLVCACMTVFFGHLADNPKKKQKYDRSKKGLYLLLNSIFLPQEIRSFHCCSCDFIFVKVVIHNIKHWCSQWILCCMNSIGIGIYPLEQCIWLFIFWPIFSMDFNYILCNSKNAFFLPLTLFSIYL